MDLVLRFDSCVIGRIVDAEDYDEDTVFGYFQPQWEEPDCPIQGRIRQFVDFSEDWHTRPKTGNPYSDSEWDVFKDVYESSLWNTVGAGETVTYIGAPTFYEGNVSWRLIAD